MGRIAYMSMIDECTGYPAADTTTLQHVVANKVRPLKRRVKLSSLREKSLSLSLRRSRPFYGLHGSERLI